MQERTQRKITVKEGTMHGEASMTKGKQAAIYNARTFVVNSDRMARRCSTLKAHFNKSLRAELRRMGIPRHIVSFETPDTTTTRAKTAKIAVTVATKDNAIGDFRQSKPRMRQILSTVMELLSEAIGEAYLTPTEKYKPKAAE